MKRNRKQKIEYLKSIAEKKALELQKLSYAELRSLIDVEIHEDNKGKGDKEDFYQIEVTVLYDDPKKTSGDLRVIISIDDGGIMSFVPINRSFIMTPEGKLL